MLEFKDECLKAVIIIMLNDVKEYMLIKNEEIQNRSVHSFAQTVWTYSIPSMKRHSYQLLRAYSLINRIIDGI